QSREEIKNNQVNQHGELNIITNEKVNKRYHEDVQLIQEYEPPIVITSLGSPAKVLEIVHSYGGLVYSDVISIRHAKKAAENGVDGLVLVAAGAGGHGGTLSPFSFTQRVREFFDKTIILSGGITKGSDVEAAHLWG